MRQQDVYTCIRIKSEAIGQLPVRLYRSINGQNVQITAGREHRIFTQKPNDYQTWQEFIEQYTPGEVEKVEGTSQKDSKEVHFSDQVTDHPSYRELFHESDEDGNEVSYDASRKLSQNEYNLNK